MIRVVMFDLGRTLVDANDRPFPHVKEALVSISKFTTPSGKALGRCLVSDFTMPTPPPTAAKIAALFKEYLAILDGTGLRQFFEPVHRRVTLSTHAGVEKPARKFFQTALRRMRVKVPLSQCLLITEDAEHVRAARENLGMATLLFRSAESTDFDFDDWAEAPLLIANLVAPTHFANVETAVKTHMAATQGVEIKSAQPSKRRGAVTVAAQVWEPITVPGYDDLRGVQVAIPVEGEVRRGSKGEVKSVALARPSAEQIAEAASFVRSLAAHGQIGGRAGTHTTATTHQIETDDKGNRRLVRKRFSAGIGSVRSARNTGSARGGAPSFRR